MPWLTPKTDWTKEDYFNFADLNRIESNTAYLADLLVSFGLTLSLTTVFDRTMFRFDYADDLNRIEINIEAVAVLLQPSGWQEMKTNWLYGDGFDYKVAIRYEKNLLLIYQMLIGNINNIHYAGTFYCGEGVI